MGTLPFFWATIRAPLHCLGPHEKRVKGYPDAPKTLGEHLRKSRLDLGETQEQAASRFGVTFTSYNGWEADRIAPKVCQWPEMVRFLGYDPSSKPVRFGEAVTYLRQSLGLDKQQFAAVLKVDVRSILNWEKHRTVPFASVRQRLIALCPDRSLAVWFRNDADRNRTDVAFHPTG